MDDPVNAFVPHSPAPIQGAPGGPLSGLTFAVKDLYDTKGDITGGGSPDWLATHEPATHTSPLVTRLLEAGADMIGKTICDEFFYSFIGDNAHYGTPTNTKAPGRMPGGSSSGSAAAVAAGLCDFALGTDTAGSIRMPASYCGLYGLRPSHGRVDLTYAMPMAQSFDTAGWFAREAGLYARLGPYFLAGAGDRRAIEHVVIADWAFDHAEDEVSGPLRAFIDKVKDQFPATSHKKDLPDGLALDQALDCLRIIQGFEVWQNYGAWAKANNPNFGPGIKQRMAMARDLTEDEKAGADKNLPGIKALICAQVPPGTVMCLPSAASLPPPIDMVPENMFDFRVANMSLICLGSLAGLPQLSIPAASVGGVPAGLSFMGWPGGDEALLDLAVQLEGYCVK